MRREMMKAPNQAGFYRERESSEEGREKRVVKFGTKLWERRNYLFHFLVFFLAHVNIMEKKLPGKTFYYLKFYHIKFFFR